MRFPEAVDSYFARASPARCLGGRLLGLLVLPNLLQRRGVHDVGNRAISVEGVVAGRLLPAVGAYAELLGHEGGEDLCLLLPEPGQRLEPVHEIRTARGFRPDPAG